MAAQIAEFDVPKLTLSSCGVGEHAQALRDLKKTPFWWYQGASRLLGNFSRPFHDDAGNWWYQVKPGFCWPVDFFRPIEPPAARPPLAKSFLCYQHVVPEETQADSHLVINAVLDLKSYGPSSVDAKRRNAIRKGLKLFEVQRLISIDRATLEGCLSAWVDLTLRTGWKRSLDVSYFKDSWYPLLDCPGVSILVSRERCSGQVAGFLIVKIVGDTAYVDTIASCDQMLGHNINDALMSTFLINASKLPGVTKAHFAIRSNVHFLEKYKTSLGFVAHPFPARTNFRPLVGTLLQRFFNDKYLRMTGVFKEEAEAPEHLTTMTPRMTAQIHEALVSAIGKSYQPMPLIGPKWFVPPDRKGVYHFVGAGKLAKAVRSSRDEVCQTLIRHLVLEDDLQAEIVDGSILIRRKGPAVSPPPDNPPSADFIPRPVEKEAGDTPARKSQEHAAGHPAKQLEE